MNVTNMDQWCHVATALTAQVDMIPDPGWIRTFGIWAALSVAVVSLINRYRALLGLEVALALGYFVLRALWLAEFPWPHYQCYNTAFEATAAQALLEVGVFVLFFRLMPNRWARRAMLGFAALMIFDMAFVWAGLQGLMVAPSFDTALMAMYLPAAPWPLQPLLLWTILSTHGSTALLILFSQCAATSLALMRSRNWRPGDLALAGVVLAPLALALVVVAWHHAHSPWFDSAVRLNGYRRYMHAWAWTDRVTGAPGFQWWSVLFGTGPGSFRFLSYEVDHYTPPLNGSLHSDHLQELSTLGLVGYVLLLAVAWRAVRNAWKSNQFGTLAMVVGALACATTYHPLRFPATVFLIGMYLRRALYVYKNETAPR